MAYQDDLKQLQDAGFSEQEQADWTNDHIKTLRDAGFGQEEIDKYLGKPPPVNTDGVKTHVEQTLAQPVVKTATEPAAEPMTFEQALPSIVGDTPKTPPAPTAPTTAQEDINSQRGGNIGMPAPANQKSVQLNAPMRRQLVQSYKDGSASTFSDWWTKASATILDAFDSHKETTARQQALLDATRGGPVNWLGKNVAEAVPQFLTNQVTGLMAALPAIPAGLYAAFKTGDMDKAKEAFATMQNKLTTDVDSGGGKLMSDAVSWAMGHLQTLGAWAGGKIDEAQSIPEAIRPALATIMHTAIEGAPLLLGLRGGPKGAVDPRVKQMADLGDNLKSSIPDAGEFVSSAQRIANGDPKVFEKLHDVYAETGKRPSEIEDDIRQDPTIKDDLLADNVVIPDAYQSIAATPETPTVTARSEPTVDTRGFKQPESEVSFGEDPAAALRAAQEKSVAKGVIMDAYRSGEIEQGSYFRGTSMGELEKIVQSGELQVGKNAEGQPGISAAKLSEDGFPMYGEGVGYIVPPRHVTDSGFAAEGFVNEKAAPQDMKYVVDGHILSFDELKKQMEEPPPVPEVEDLDFTKRRNAQLDKESDAEDAQLIKEANERAAANDHENVKAATSKWGQIGLLYDRAKKAWDEGAVPAGQKDYDTQWALGRVEAFMKELRSYVAGDKPGLRAQNIGVLSKDFDEVRSTLNKYLSDVAQEPTMKADEMPNPPPPEFPAVKVDEPGGKGAQPPAPPPPAGMPPGSSPDPWGNVASHIDWGGKNLKQPWTIKSAFNEAYRRIIDKLDPILRGERDMEALRLENGEPNPAVAVKPYTVLRQTAGNAGRAQYQLEGKTYDAVTYKDNGAGLQDIMAPVKDDQKAFWTFAASKRALEYEQAGLKSGINPDDARIVVEQGEARFGKVFRDLVDYQNRVAENNLVSTGIMSREAFEEMKADNKDFVPFHRVFEDSDASIGFGGRGAVRNPIKARTGSERDVIDPLESIVKNTYVYTSLGELNKAVGAWVKGAEATGMPEQFMERVPPKIAPVAKLSEDEITRLFNEFVTVNKKTSTTSTTTTTSGGAAAAAADAFPKNTARVKDALTARGFSDAEADIMINRLRSAGTKGGESVDTLTKEVTNTEYVPELNVRLPSPVATVFRALREPLEKDQIAFFRDGKREVYRVNPDVAEAFRGMDETEAGFLTKMLAAPAGALRVGAIYSPDFAGRNIFRDQVETFVLSPIGKSIPFYDWLSGLYSMAKQDAAYDSFMKAGGANSTIMSLNRDSVQMLLEHAGVAQETGLMTRAWNVIKSPYTFLQAAAHVSEQATRIGHYKREVGNVETASAPQMLEAGLATRSAPFDPMRGGSDPSIRALNRISDFFNANLQANDTFFRALADNPGGTLAKVAAGIVLPSFLLYQHNKTDPRWNDGSIPQWQKDLFWIYLTPDHVLRFPKMSFPGVFFGSGSEHVMQAFEESQQKAGVDMKSVAHYFGNLQGTLTSNVIPNAALPILEQIANYNMFSGNKLIPDRLEKLAPEYQYSDYTTETSKALGRLVGTFPGMNSELMPKFVSQLQAPVVIDNYIRAWSGSLGAYAMQAADAGLRAAHVLPNPVTPASTVADIPFVKAFVVRYPSAQAQAINDFEERQQEHETYYNTFKMLLQNGDTEGLYRFLHADRTKPLDQQSLNEAAAKIVKLDAIKQDLSKQSQIIHKVYINPTYTAEEKRQLIDAIYMQMIVIGNAGNQAFREIDQSLGRSVAKTATP